ncbi:hypothetical protein B0H13DRAFT_2556767 [Mycena leptocephala]|nr:hypothetical protein B0H13DRAFT_2556767 [Mycena leptocephala]
MSTVRVCTASASVSARYPSAERADAHQRRKPRIQVEGPKSREWQKGSSRWKIVWKTQTNSLETLPIHGFSHHPQVPLAFLVQDADCGGGGNGTRAPAVTGFHAGDSIQRTPGIQNERERRQSQARRVHCRKKQRDSGQEIAQRRTRNPERDTKEHSPKNPRTCRQIRMVTRYSQRTRERNLERDDGLHAESDGVNEVDDVRGEGAWGGEEGGGYEALFRIYISVGRG